MSRRRFVAAVAATALALGLLTCQNDTTQPPTPGWVDLLLTSPNADDGGILFTVSGAPIDSARSSFPSTFLRHESDAAIRVAIVGNMGSGVIGQILVPDTRNLSGYAATVVEVAARGTFVQRPLTGYALRIDPGPY